MKKIILLIYLSLSSNLYSQDNNINFVFDFITTKQGLSHNYTTSIISDDLNIKWIGTENGITKFNGYDFEYLKPGDEYKELLNENIEVLFKDKSNNIWIGTKSGGLSYLDIKNNSIKCFNHLIDLSKEGDLRITAISQDTNGNIWIGTWKNGVFVIDYHNEKLIKHFKSNYPIFSIVADFHGNIWFSKNSKVLKYAPSEDKIDEYQFNRQVSDILADPSRDKIWIATTKEDTKLYSFNYKTQAIETLETGVTSGFSKKLSIDRYNRIWIGTWRNGVYISNENLTKFSEIELVSVNSDKIRANYRTILNIHHDKNNITWLATANGGIVKLIEGNGFKNANKFIKNAELNSHLNITSIFKNKKNLFLGTLYSGLYYGKDFSDLKQIKAIGNIQIFTIYEHKNMLYIGGIDGFYVFDLKLEKLVFSSKILNKVTSFYIDAFNNLYIGTQQQGLAIVKTENIENENAYVIYSNNLANEQKIKSNRITGIQEDENGNIWVSSYNGLHLYDRQNKIFKHQSLLLNEKLPSAIINSITIRDHHIWLATPNGLIKLNYKNNKLIVEDRITKAEGLYSNFICSSTFDDLGNLWLSTNTEIVKYNVTNRSIISYGEINGVNTTSFNNRSFFNYKNETIYFGGIDNLTFFKPSTITKFNIVPEVIFTKLRVNNKLIEYGPGIKIIDQNFNYSNKIKLTHKDNSFSTSFVANDFLGNLNIKYRYSLNEGQNSWIDLQNRNEINFAGLSPGNYTFKVEASRANQNWSSPKSIEIILLSSPWKTPLALSIYAIILFLIIAYFIISNNYKLKLKNSLEIARIDKDKEIELSEAKLNFFTNISHEFRTPLTLIKSPLIELLEIEGLSPKVVKNLNFIDRNTKRLLNLINQLLDFRKADHGLLKLNVSQDNFVRLSKEVHLYFLEAAKSKHLKFKFNPSTEEILFPFDRNKMEIVLCNLISNAIKYCNHGDEIIMTIDADAEFCIISIKDTGIGMNSDNRDRIFDRFFQIKSANTAQLVGSGIGLAFSKKIIELHHGSINVKSKENVGTEFIIKLSMNPKLYEGEINEAFFHTDNTKELAASIDNLSINVKEPTILVIDDNLEILSYLKDILSDTYNVIQADNGNAGFVKASSEIPDLIVSDVMMPGKDGITLCKELKSQITTSHIPILLLTAKTSTVFEIEGLKTGADDYVSKPFNAKVLKARISSLLENREKLRSHLLNKVRFQPTPTEIEKDTNTESAFIHKAIVLVENNIQNSSFGIDTMVDELNMSQSTLYRKIKSLTGLSLTSFIRSIRLKEGAHLILIDELNLSQIAYEVGFNDYKYFKISFENQFNCLPSKYKAKITKINI